MSAIPRVDTDSQPPMAIPLRHFLVGLGFLLAGVLVAAADAAGVASGLVGPARYHLLLAEWFALPGAVRLAGGVAFGVGVSLFVHNLASVVREYGPRGVVGTVLPLPNRLGGDGPTGAGDDSPSSK
ncbi:hypothetical protein [Halopelagius fulvigenes]|uniref:Uncharacterized protein n=1 Tax=Halopelagius fulvigenes TaxID=1198324 RepID=A0ABD5TSH1_9EURY